MRSMVEGAGVAIVLHRICSKERWLCTRQSSGVDSALSWVSMKSPPPPLFERSPSPANGGG
jgi:hypothetical protein